MQMLHRTWLLMVCSTSLAQATTLAGLIQIWYSQMTDHNLRLNEVAPYAPGIRPEYKENGFSLRRVEIKASGKITEELSWDVGFDPSKNATSGLLEDALITFRPARYLEFKVGQFKTLQTLEGLASSSELKFIERSLVASLFGDVRDRGVVGSFVSSGDSRLRAKASLGVFNGQGKTDLNAQKDVVGRLEFSAGPTQQFGIYTLLGSTDQPDDGTLAARTFVGTGTPAAEQVLANRDRTRQFGAFYQYQDAEFYYAAEIISGLLGRRFASVGTPGPALREHLDQRFLGMCLTGARSFGPHTLLLRCDKLDFNAGGRWYGSTNPYKSASVDFTPTYRQIVAGYTYAFRPEKVKAANLKLNYIARSKNVLKPRAGQFGAQGGDTLLAQFQVAF